MSVTLAAAKAARDISVSAHASQLAEFQVWRPTPTRAEYIPDGVVIGAVHDWDLSPLDRDAFDASEPPGRPIPPAPPINTSPPNFVALAGLEVGDALAGQQGTWSGPGIRYPRQWFRGSRPIVGQTNPAYTLTASDVGYMVTIMLTATTSAGGQGIAMAQAVEPILPAAPRSTLVVKVDFASGRI
jgi:hypothetical protein